MKHFQFRRISREDSLINEVYKLRYKVYCDEWGFEHPEDHPRGIECDIYDEHSVHFGALEKESGQLIGTIRCILYSDVGFPIEKHCVITRDLSYFDKSKFAEISRLAVSKEYRRRAVDRLIYGDGMYREEKVLLAKERREKEYLIVMGLYLTMYKECLALGLTHWYALMAEGLFALLRRMEIHFEPIGPEIDHHGMRAPYFGSIGGIAERVSSGKAEILKKYENAMESRQGMPKFPIPVPSVLRLDG